MAEKKKLTVRRKKKPAMIAVINENCTGCAGSPACQDYCPVENCMILVQDDATPFSKIIVDPLQCIGCTKCVSKGPHGTFLDGCPWDAIDMIPLAQFESLYGPLAY